jgi:hypothetical protein
LVAFGLEVVVRLGTVGEVAAKNGGDLLGGGDGEGDGQFIAGFEGIW